MIKKLSALWFLMSISIVACSPTFDIGDIDESQSLGRNINLQSDNDYSESKASPSANKYDDHEDDDENDRDYHNENNHSYRSGFDEFQFDKDGDLIMTDAFDNQFDNIGHAGGDNTGTENRVREVKTSETVNAIDQTKTDNQLKPSKEHDNDDDDDDDDEDYEE